MLQQLINLINEYMFALGHTVLNVHDLLADELIDRLHVLKHLVHFIIQAFQLFFVLAQILLIFSYCSLAVSALHHRRVPKLHILNLQFLVDLANRVKVQIHCLDLRILKLSVAVLDEFSSLFVDWSPHLANVARERSRQHVLVQSWEFLEDRVVQEVLC
jgi:hypothetical protein